jgi:hypothetical protein
MHRFEGTEKSTVPEYDLITDLSDDQQDKTPEKHHLYRPLLNRMNI